MANNQVALEEDDEGLDVLESMETENQAESKKID